MSVYGYDSGSSRRHRGPLRKLWNAITWPFRAVERVEARVAAWADGRRRSFRHKYRHSKVVAPLVESLVWLLLLPFRLVWMLITAPFRLIGTTSRTMSARQSREWMHLIQGLPAVVAGSGVFVVLMLLTTQAEELPLEYLQRAQSAYNAEHFRQAEVYLHRALQLDPDSDEATYLLARTLEQNGQTRRAMAILDSLAPDDRRGDPRAHLRKAEILFTELQSRKETGDSGTAATREEWSRLLEHVQHAEAGMRSYSAQQRSDLDYFRGIIHYNMGEMEAAREYLERASRTREELNIVLAALYDDLGQTAKAQQRRERARSHFESRLKENSADTRARVDLVRLVMQDRNYDEAIRVLQEGRQAAPEDEQLQKLLAEVLVYRFDSLPAGTDPSVGMGLLENALKVDPECSLAVDRLLRLGSRGNKQVARELLESLIAVGSSAPLAHFALGVMAWEEEDSENAVWHLERAYKLDPELTVVGNNLAWLLAHDERNPQPERALQLINSVLESRPDQLSYVETRGQIYVKLGRWEAALDDLERALPKYNYTVDIHESLSTVYENLGQKGLANKHKTVAANLRRMEQERR